MHQQQYNPAPQQRVDAARDGLIAKAAECGIHVVDTYGPFYEIEFLSIVDAQALIDFITAFRSYSERDAAQQMAILSASEQPDSDPVEPVPIAAQ